jgi:hypothetical protein
MQITRLPSGQRAPDEVDCVSVEEKGDGTFVLQGTALIACGDSDEAESVALVGLEPFASREQAEEVGLAWAAEQCVEHLYVADVSFYV